MTEARTNWTRLAPGNVSASWSPSHPWICRARRSTGTVRTSDTQKRRRKSATMCAWWLVCCSCFIRLSSVVRPSRIVPSSLHHDRDDLRDLVAALVLGRDAHDPARLEVGQREWLLDESRLPGLGRARELTVTIFDS